MQRAGRSRQGRDKGRKKRTERSRKSLSCWFKLGQGATDLEPKGQSGSSSQTSLVLRQGPRGSTLQHRRVRRQPETLGSGSSGLAPASVSPQHSTQTHGPLPSRSSFPSLGSHGHSQVLWRRPRRPRPDVKPELFWKEEPARTAPKRRAVQHPPFCLNLDIASSGSGLGEFQRKGTWEA